MNWSECLNIEQEQEIFLSFDLKYIRENSLLPDFKVLIESLS